MATKIKVVTARDFVEITPEGTIDITTSQQLLVDIAKAERPPVDYDLLIDFRDTTWHMSTTDIYQLAAALTRHGDTFRRRVAILVLPGVNFDPASFLETCSHNRGFQVDAFTDFETAMRWLLSSKDSPKDRTPPDKADTSDDG
jgi:anti-anti-sigma regulatory factor